MQCKLFYIIIAVSLGLFVSEISNAQQNVYTGGPKAENSLSNIPPYFGTDLNTPSEEYFYLALFASFENPNFQLSTASSKVKRVADFLFYCVDEDPFLGRLASRKIPEDTISSFRSLLILYVRLLSGDDDSKLPEPPSAPGQVAHCRKVPDGISSTNWYAAVFNFLNSLGSLGPMLQHGNNFFVEVNKFLNQTEKPGITVHDLLVLYLLRNPHFFTLLKLDTYSEFIKSNTAPLELGGFIPDIGESARKRFRHKTSPSLWAQQAHAEAVFSKIGWDELGMNSYEPSLGIDNPFSRALARFRFENPTITSFIPVIGTAFDIAENIQIINEGIDSEGKSADQRFAWALLSLNVAFASLDAGGIAGISQHGLKSAGRLAKKASVSTHEHVQAIWSDFVQNSFDPVLLEKVKLFRTRFGSKTREAIKASRSKNFLRRMNKENLKENGHYQLRNNGMIKAGVLSSQDADNYSKNLWAGVVSAASRIRHEADFLPKETFRYGWDVITDRISDYYRLRPDLGGTEAYEQVKMFTRKNIFGDYDNRNYGRRWSAGNLTTSIWNKYKPWEGLYKDFANLRGGQRAYFTQGQGVTFKAIRPPSSGPTKGNATVWIQVNDYSLYGQYPGMEPLYVIVHHFDPGMSKISNSWLTKAEAAAFWTNENEKWVDFLSDKMKLAAVRDLPLEEIGNRVASFHWWCLHAALNIRGTMGACDAMSKALFLSHGIEVGEWAETMTLWGRQYPGGVDHAAFVTSHDEFVNLYPTLFHRVDEAPIPAVKTYGIPQDAAYAEISSAISISPIIGLSISGGTLRGFIHTPGITGGMEFSHYEMGGMVTLSDFGRPHAFIDPDAPEELVHSAIDPNIPFYSDKGELVSSHGIDMPVETLCPSGRYKECRIRSSNIFGYPFQPYESLGYIENPPCTLTGVCMGKSLGLISDGYDPVLREVIGNGLDIFSPRLVLDDSRAYQYSTTVDTQTGKKYEVKGGVTYSHSYLNGEPRLEGFKMGLYIDSIPFDYRDSRFCSFISDDIIPQKNWWLRTQDIPGSWTIHCGNRTAATSASTEPLPYSLLVVQK